MRFCTARKVLKHFARASPIGRRIFLFTHSSLCRNSQFAISKKLNSLPLYSFHNVVRTSFFLQMKNYCSTKKICAGTHVLRVNTLRKKNKYKIFFKGATTCTPDIFFYDIALFSFKKIASLTNALCFFPKKRHRHNLELFCHSPPSLNVFQSTNNTLRSFQFRKISDAIFSQLRSQFHFPKTDQK